MLGLHTVFRLATRVFSHLLVVFWQMAIMTPWDDPKPLKLIWRLYEIVCAIVRHPSNICFVFLCTP